MILKVQDRISLRVTEHNDPIEGLAIEDCFMIANTLFFLISMDPDVSPEEPNLIWSYQLTDEQRDKILSWPESERNLSVEWVYTPAEGAGPQDFIFEADYQDLDEKHQEAWVWNLDISI